MNRIAVAFAAALVLAPAVSLAQTAPPPTPAPAPPPPRNLTPSFASSSGVEGEIHRQNMDSRARQAVQNTSPGRMSRAERVAEMINAGDCAGAHALALAENDRRLARRVAQVCEIETN